VDPNDLKLMFEGEVLNLDNTTEDCDIEEEDCIDVIISEPIKE
jgi:hypothetical protein